MKYIFIVLSSIIFFGCSGVGTTAVKKIEKKVLINIDDNLSCEELSKLPPEKELEIYDLRNIPQEAEYFLRDLNKSAVFYDIQKKYEKYYFSVWNIGKPKESLEEVKWPFASYCASKSYGENLQPLKQEFFDKMLKEANFDMYSSVNSRAVTLVDSDIRAFPTNKPLFKDPSIAGEGFPFDYLQNSTVYANKPVLISHYSLDREWAYVFTSFTSGWIESNKLVILDKAHTDAWQDAQQVTIIKENVSIYDEKNHFLFKSKIGMMFALISEDESTYTILTVSSYKNSKPLFVKSKISKDIAAKGILELNRKNLDLIVSETTKTTYGWGGMYGQRDCSSMLRDLYAPFGIWLPRNSFQQSKMGEVISLETLTDKEKIDIIKEKAIPFETLLYKKGHIVLYVGIYNNEIVILHNTWGIKTKKDDIEGRIIVGKPVFSTLRLGKYQKDYDEKSEILKNLKSMNILTR